MVVCGPRRRIRFYKESCSQTLSEAWAEKSVILRCPTKNFRFFNVCENQKNSEDIKIVWSITQKKHQEKAEDWMNLFKSSLANTLRPLLLPAVVATENRQRRDRQDRTSGQRPETLSPWHHVFLLLQRKSSCASRPWWLLVVFILRLLQRFTSQTPSRQLLWQKRKELFLPFWP